MILWIWLLVRSPDACRASTLEVARDKLTMDRRHRFGAPPDRGRDYDENDLVDAPSHDCLPDRKTTNILLTPTAPLHIRNALAAGHGEISQ